MLHKKIEVLSSLSDGLSRRANLDAMLGRIAAFLGQVGVETRGSLIAAGVARKVFLEEEVGRLRVRTAVVDLSADKLLIACHALEFLQACKHLPKDFLPADLLLSQEHDELVDVPVFVALVLGDHLTVAVDKQLRSRAMRPLTLVRRVQRAAVDATMQHVLLFFEKVLQLLHEQLGLELVLLIV